MRKALHSRSFREIEMPKTRNGPTQRGASGAQRQAGGTGNDPHQGALAEVSRMLLEAEAHHEAASKQTAAGAAAEASEKFAAQFRAFFPPPALLRDTDAGFGPTAELDAAAQVASALAAPVAVAPWAAVRVSPPCPLGRTLPPRLARNRSAQTLSGGAQREKPSCARSSWRNWTRFSPLRPRMPRFQPANPFTEFSPPARRDIHRQRGRGRRRRLRRGRRARARGGLTFRTPHAVFSRHTHGLLRTTDW